MNLRRAASYSLDKTPMSSTSSRFSFNHLYASPPPSPGLPQLIPPKRRSSFKTPRPSRILRAVIYLAGAVSAVYLLIIGIWGDGYTASTSSSGRGSATMGGLYAWPTELKKDGVTYEMAVNSRLPNHPTPVIARDRHGKPKWTVFVPPNHKFPLALDEYSDICAKCVAVANKVDELKSSKNGISAGISSLSGFGGKKPRGPKTAAERFRSTDANFIDVHEAEVAEFLPGSVSIGTLLSQQANDGDIVGETQSSLLGKPVCDRSLTFVLASTDAGIGRTLMLLWMAYAQAQKEGRGFFVDDSRWAYGKYADIFAPPPMPDCRPPLRHEMLPCPRQSRHLVVTMETASFFFGFGDVRQAGDDSDPPKHQESAAVSLLSEIGLLSGSEHSAAHMFDLARQGYKALFRLNADDAKHVVSRADHLRGQTIIKRKRDASVAAASAPVPRNAQDRGTIVGLHIRRGDRHPVEFQYSDSYIPLNIYADRAAEEILSAEKHKQKQSKKAKAEAGSHAAASLMVVASDDPTVYESFEFANAARAQEHIRLASKYADDASAKQESNPGAFRKFVDETFGWEGGFFSAMFWNLGRPQPSSPDEAALSSVSASAAAAADAPSPDTVRIRSLVARAYMMDLAVLAEVSDSIVCAVSATGCRLLAVMMGWEAAMEQGRWINIDGADEYGWWAVDF